MNNYQKEARLTNIKNNIKVLEGAAERYYLDHQKWPRSYESEDNYYTKEELEIYAKEFLSITGEPMVLDENGKYYSIDYSLLSDYVQKPKDEFQYVIQNPVGEIYYLKDLTEQGKEVIKKPNGSKPDLPEEPGLPEEPDLPEEPEEFLSINSNSVLYLNFKNENPIVDYSGNNHTITNNSAGWTTEGLSFNGSHNVIVPHNPVIKPKTVTVAVRAYIDTTIKKDLSLISLFQTGGYGMVIKNTSGNDSKMDKTTAYSIYFAVHDGSKYRTVSLPVSDVSTGWHTLVGSYDGQTLNLFVDGLLKDTTYYSTASDIKYSFDNALQIGASAGGGNSTEGGYFQGKISHVAVYNEALTVKEIAKLVEKVKPIAKITMTPNTIISVNSNITWSYSDSTDANGDAIINAEWIGKQEKYTEPGNYTVKLRVQDETGLWSDWTEVNFGVMETENNFLNFNGTSSYVKIPHSALIKPTAAFTYELWAYKDDWKTTNTEKMISTTQSGGMSISLTSGKVTSEVYVGSSYKTLNNTPTTELKDGWNHFALTFDGRYFKFYINGVCIQMYDRGGIGTMAQSSSSIPLAIGAEPEGSSSAMQYFNGKILNVRVWNLARTEEEIAQNIYKELNGDEAGLTGYWKLNEGSGTIAYDSSQNGNHGTIINATW